VANGQKHVIIALASCVIFNACSERWEDAIRVHAAVVAMTSETTNISIGLSCAAAGTIDVG
jgi:hypothetical protein